MKRLTFLVLTIISIFIAFSIVTNANSVCKNTVLGTESVESILPTNQCDASVLLDGIEDTNGRFSADTDSGLSWTPTSTGDGFTLTLKKEELISNFAFFGWSNGSTYKFEFFDNSGTSVYVWEETINIQSDVIEPIYVFENGNYSIKTIVFTVTSLKFNRPRTCLISELYIYSPNHSYGEPVSYSYPNGFSGECIINQKCTLCDSTISKIAPPVFEHLGFSVKSSDTSLGLCGMFKINTSALNWYKNNISNDISYGLVVANAKTFNSDTFFDQNGCITNQKALQLEITDDSFSKINITISNFTNDTLDLELVIFMYVKDNDKITYIQKSADLDYYTSKLSLNGVSLGAMTYTQIEMLLDKSITYALPTGEKKY